MECFVKIRTMSDENGAVGVVLGVGEENSCVRANESNFRQNSSLGVNNSEHRSTKEIDAVVQSNRGRIEELSK